MADPSTEAPKQHSQPSRKGKKAWRKNVDLTEIHSGLEQVREEIIQGGVVAELPSDALFVTDTAGSTNIRQSYVSKNKPLKADQILAERSAIPALSSHKRPSDSVIGDGVVKKKHKKDGVSAKEYARLRSVAYGGESAHKDVVKNDEDASFDPWDMPVPVQKKEFDYLKEKKPVREPATLKAAPISLAANGRSVKAVRKPAAEKSYNPTFEDWAGRLEREGAKEVSAEQKRLDAAAAEAEKREKIEKAWEESDDENRSEFESEWEGIASENEQTPEWMIKKPTKRKTKTERNKIARRKDQERLQKHEEKLKAKELQAERVKTLAKEAKEKEKQKALELAEKLLEPEEDSDDGEDVELKRHRPFGKAPLPAAPLEVLLVEDLPDSLRKLKPEGNLLGDRYRSLLLRGKVESRRRSQQKKPEKKYTEKWSYKDWKLK